MQNPWHLTAWIQIKSLFLRDVENLVCRIVVFVLFISDSRTKQNVPC
jgi:hypothetical protein